MPASCGELLPRLAELLRGRPADEAPYTALRKRGAGAGHAVRGADGDLHHRPARTPRTIDPLADLVQDASAALESP
ncbi:hypothetical protein ABZT27_23215 [Streptomyces sp. NPDC005389]|uniref:hypothetical protein n=1 Tax=Streptomyces sp. NPDC005389 TaxID=3157040 RepID=UPI00339E4FD5